jgi:hypothetical protein
MPERLENQADKWALFGAVAHGIPCARRAEPGGVKALTQDGWMMLALNFILTS